MHLHEEAAAHAGPLLRESDRPFAEDAVDQALRRGGGVDEDQLIAAFRVILAARAAALAPERGLSIRSASDIRPADDLDPSAPMIPREWFDDAAPEPASAAGTNTLEVSTTDDALVAEIMAVAERVIDLQNDEGISPAQQQQTRQSAALFRELTGVTDLRDLRQRHLALFAD